MPCCRSIDAVAQSVHVENTEVPEPVSLVLIARADRGSKTVRAL
jgi:hypothetical protein